MAPRGPGRQRRPRGPTGPYVSGSVVALGAERTGTPAGAPGGGVDPEPASGPFWSPLLRARLAGAAEARGA